MPQRKGWTSVALPDEIIKRIDDVIESKEHGFKSRNGFVLEAVKFRLKDLGYYK
jgi:metal-responsive CopG/Arc/MetJ family transcriptional regulator